MRFAIGRASSFILFVSYLSHIVTPNRSRCLQRESPRSARRCSMASIGGRIRVHRTQNAKFTHVTDNDLDTETQSSEETVHQFSRFNSTHSSQHIHSSSTANRLRDIMSKLDNPTTPPKPPPSDQEPEPDSDFDLPSGRPLSGDSLRSIFQRATRGPGDTPEIKRTQTSLRPRDTTDDEDADGVNRAYYGSNYPSYSMC